MAVARDFKKADNHIIAVIGDGAMSAGMAFEAMNNAGAQKSRLIVILNDNDMSIAPPVGAMSAYLARLLSSNPYHKLRDAGKKLADKFPAPLADMMRRAEHMARDIATGGTLFEQLGFYYVGPVDGHNINHLLPIFENIKSQKDSGPVLVHVVTEKGRGFHSPDSSSEKFHAVSTFDSTTLIQNKSKSAVATYTNVFADALIQTAKEDPSVLAITAAMPSGTGLDKFGEHFPDRTFDVGIAEQHAVTFAAGLAMEGMKPYVCIYSTFLQRAYDQIVHDVALQNLPVRFIIDRAGYVGADGATHAGSFDIAYLSCIPNMVIAAPADADDLTRLIAFSANHNNGPLAIRFPRGAANTIKVADTNASMELGKGRMITESNGAIAILNFGARLEACMEAATSLAEEGINVAIADARFAKPLDTKLIDKLLKNHKLLITIEEGSAGGFGSQVMYYAAEKTEPHTCSIYPIYYPDEFIDHATQDEQHQQVQMDATSIATRIKSVAKRDNITD